MQWVLHLATIFAQAAPLYWWIPVVSVAILVATFIIGSGTIGKHFARRMQLGADAEQAAKLRLEFATVSSMNDFRQSLEADVRAVRAMGELSLKQSEQAITMAQEAKVQTEQQALRLEGQYNLMREALAPLTGMQKKLEEVGENLAAQTQLLTRHLDRQDALDAEARVHTDRRHNAP